MKVDWTTCASPNTRPDVSCCTLPDLMRRPAGPRAYKELAEYLQENPLPEQSRVRPAAHLVARNATYLEQLNRAYRLMRELPSTDPRSHAQQVNLHCMYGNSGTGIVMQQAPAGVGGEPRREYSTHRNWLWLPFHRWLTFFYERILARLVGDEQFVLPFWNWDNQSWEVAADGHGSSFLPNIVPHFYRDPDKYPALFDATRDPRHAPGNPDFLVDLTFNQSADDPEEKRRVNNQLLHHYMSTTTQGPHDRIRFLSQPSRAGDDPVPLMDDDTFEFRGPRLDVRPQSRLARHGPQLERPQGPHLHGPPRQRRQTVGRVAVLGRQGLRRPRLLGRRILLLQRERGAGARYGGGCPDHRKLKLDWQQVDNPWLALDGGPPYRHDHPAAAAARAPTLLRASADALSMSHAS